jgi:hypothetical protein
MSDPINPVSHDYARWADPSAEKPDQRSSPLCGNPRSVVAGMFCGDDVAVSNACRKALPGSAEAFLCDDRKLKEAQDLVEQTFWDILKALLLGRLARIVK